MILLFFFSLCEMVFYSQDGQMNGMCANVYVCVLCVSRDRKTILTKYITVFFLIKISLCIIRTGL